MVDSGKCTLPGLGYWTLHRWALKGRPQTSIGLNDSYGNVVNSLYSFLLPQNHQDITISFWGLAVEAKLRRYTIVKSRIKPLMTEQRCVAAITLTQGSTKPTLHQSIDCWTFLIDHHMILGYKKRNTYRTNSRIFCSNLPYFISWTHSIDRNFQGTSKLRKIDGYAMAGDYDHLPLSQQYVMHLIFHPAFWGIP